MANLLSTALFLFPSAAAAQTVDEWPMFGGNAEHTGRSASTLPIPNMPPLKWSYTIPSSAPHNQVNSSPAIVGERVYVGCNDRYLYCLHADTGALLWRYSTGGAITSSPAVVDGRVYFVSGNHPVTGAADHHLYCLTTSGLLLWKYKLGHVWSEILAAGGWVDSSPTVVDGRVYVGSRDGAAYCLDADPSDGVDEGAPDTAGGLGGLADLIWKTQLVDGSNPGSYINSTPAVSWNAANTARLVFLGGTGTAPNGLGRFYTLSASTGAVLWQYEIPAADGVPGENDERILSSPTVIDTGGERAVVLGSCNYNVYCFLAEPNPLFNQPMWKQFVNNGASSGCEIRGTPAFADGRVFVTTGKGISCLAPSNGAIVWQGPVEEEMWSSPAVGDAKVFHTREAHSGLPGMMRWCSPTNGAVQWSSYPGWTEQNSSPAVAYGRVYVGHRGGRVLCYGP